MGIIADRTNRVSAICIALGLATISYTLVGLHPDPFDRSFIPLAVLLGIGEVSVIVATGSLFGQEARASLRGTLVGVFSMMGGLGIIVVSFFGGIIYDAVSRSAPFTVMGMLNGLLLLAALFVRLRAGNPAPRAAVLDNQ